MNYFWAPVNINTLYCWVRILDTKIPLRLGWLPGRPHDWPFDHFHNWPYEHIFWEKKYFLKAYCLVMTMTETKTYRKTNTKTKTHRQRQIHGGHEQGGHGHDGHVRPHQNASIHKNVKSDQDQCGQYLGFLTQRLFGVFLRSLRICAGQHTWIISNFKARNQLYIASVKTKLTSKRQDPSFEHCPQGFRKFSDPCSCSF